MSFIPTRPPTTYVHTRLVDYTGGDVHYLPTGDVHCWPAVCRKNSCLRFHALHARQFQCMCLSRLGRPCRFFSVCNTSPPPSLQLAFCGMSPLTSHSVTRVLCGIVNRITAAELHIDFLLRRVTRVLWGVSHMTQHCLYLQCSLVSIWLSSSFETSRRFLRGAFSKEKETTSGRGWQHHMWIHTALWTQDALYLRKPSESEPQECGRIPATCVFLPVFSYNKNQECWSGRPRVIYIYSHFELKTHFTWENTGNLEELVRHAFSLKKATESGRSWPHYM